MDFEFDIHAPVKCDVYSAITSQVPRLSVAKVSRVTYDALPNARHAFNIDANGRELLEINYILSCIKIAAELLTSRGYEADTKSLRSMARGNYISLEVRPRQAVALT